MFCCTSEPFVDVEFLYLMLFPTLLISYCVYHLPLPLSLIFVFHTVLTFFSTDGQNQSDTDRQEEARLCRYARVYFVAQVRPSPSQKDRRGVGYRAG